MVDIEITAAGEFRKLRSICDQTRTLLIGSYHNFTLTPDAESLEVIHATGRALGADIVKVALMPQNRERPSPPDRIHVAPPDRGHYHHRHGRDRRIVPRLYPLLGSLSTYGTVTRSTAPDSSLRRSLPICCIAFTSASSALRIFSLISFLRFPDFRFFSEDHQHCLIRMQVFLTQPGGHLPW